MFPRSAPDPIATSTRRSRPMDRRLAWDGELPVSHSSSVPQLPGGEGRPARSGPP